MNVSFVFINSKLRADGAIETLVETSSTIRGHLGWYDPDIRMEAQNRSTYIMAIPLKPSPDPDQPHQIAVAEVYARLVHTVAPNQPASYKYNLCHERDPVTDHAQPSRSHPDGETVLLPKPSSDSRCVLLLRASLYIGASRPLLLFRAP